MPRILDTWRLAAAHFFIVSALFVTAGVVSFWPSGATSARLIPRETDTIGVEDVMTSTRSGNLREAGIILLILVGPAAETLQSSIALLAGAVLPFLVATALHNHLRSGALAGITWAVVVLVVSVVMLEQISVSYSFAARMFMFGPAAIVNTALILLLSRGLRVRVHG